jgi:hypothetical protein
VEERATATATAAMRWRRAAATQCETGESRGGSRRGNGEEEADAGPASELKRGSEQAAGAAEPGGMAWPGMGRAASSDAGWEADGAPDRRGWTHGQRASRAAAAWASEWVGGRRGHGVAATSAAPAAGLGAGAGRRGLAMQRALHQRPHEQLTTPRRTSWAGGVVVSAQGCAAGRGHRARRGARRPGMGGWRGEERKRWCPGGAGPGDGEETSPATIPALLRLMAMPGDARRWPHSSEHITVDLAWIAVLVSRCWCLCAAGRVVQRWCEAVLAVDTGRLLAAHTERRGSTPAGPEAFCHHQLPESSWPTTSMAIIGDGELQMSIPWAPSESTSRHAACGRSIAHRSVGELQSR